MKNTFQKLQANGSLTMVCLQIYQELFQLATFLQVRFSGIYQDLLLPLQLIPIPLIQFGLFKLLKVVVLDIECYVITMAIKLQLELIFKELSATQVFKRSSKTTFFYSESILYIRNLESQTLGKQEGFYSKKHRLHRHHSLGREQ